METMLVCVSCGDRYPTGLACWKCDCGDLLDLEIHPKIDRRKIQARPLSMWRYREALPIQDDAHVITVGEGFTPLIRFSLGGREVLVKQDQLFPSGSYKDRGAAVLISKAKELGIQRVVEDSSGNAGCAVASWCARGGIECQIFVPDSTSPGKTAQIEMYGAELVLVPGSREDTARAVLAAAQKDYYASHSWNPYFFHGTKTWAYEVWEQLGWQAPDTVVLPAGNGTLLLGAAIGFRELFEAGEIAHIPKIVAVQSQACAPLARAFRNGLDQPILIEKQDTLAEGIAIAEPVRGAQILAAVRASGGTFLTVSEEEIETALLEVIRQGAYIEPTAAAAAAGAACYLEQAADNELVVTVFTGHGLKSTEKMLKILAHRWNNRI